MRFKIIPLEERIVLDAVGLAQVAATIVDSYSFDHQSSQPGTLTDAHLGQDALSVDNGSAPDTSPTHLLIISTHVQDYQDLAKTANSNTIVVTYDPATVSLNDLSAKITSALGGRQADSIAFANDGGPDSFNLTDQYRVSLDTLTASQELQTFWENVSAMVKDGGRIDLLSCDLARDSQGVNLINDLDALATTSTHTITFAASTDMTANPAQGGNWMLEVGNVDVSTTYFNSSLSSWTGALGSSIASFTIGHYILGGPPASVLATINSPIGSAGEATLTDDHGNTISDNLNVLPDYNSVGNLDGWTISGSLKAGLIETGPFFATLTFHDDSAYKVFEWKLLTETIPVTFTGDPLQRVDNGQTLTAVAGGSITGTTIPNSQDVVLAEFTDPLIPNSPPTDYTVEVFWGDGISSIWTEGTTDGVGGHISVLSDPNHPGDIIVAGNHTYSIRELPGLYNVQVFVSKPNLPFDPGYVSTVNLKPPPLIVSNSGNYLGPFTTTDGSNLNTTLQPINYELGYLASIDPYKVTIQWGDGGLDTQYYNDPGQTGNITGQLVSGSHVFPQRGNYLVSVTVLDLSTNQTTTLIDPINIQSGPFQLYNLATITEPAFTTPDVLQYSVSIDWGDNSLVQHELYHGSPQLSAIVEETHNYTKAGTYNVTVTVDQFLIGTDENQISVIHDTINFSNEPMQILNPYNNYAVDNNPMTYNSPNVLSNSFQQGSGQTYLAGGGGAVVVSAFSDNESVTSANQFIANINWGDGSLDTSGIVVQHAPGEYTVFGDHIYQTSGAKTITTTIRAPDGVTATSTTLVTVAPVASNISGFGQTFAVDSTLLSTTPAPELATYQESGTTFNVNNLTATALWSDGTSSSLIISGGNAQGNTTQAIISGYHDFSQVGEPTVQITVVNNLTHVTSVYTEQIRVMDSQFVGISPTLQSSQTGTSVNYGPKMAFNESFNLNVGVSGNQTTAVQEDPQSNWSNLEAFVNWGDGTIQPINVPIGTLLPDGLGSAITTTFVNTNAFGTPPTGSLTFSLGNNISHTYTTAGNFVITVDLFDAGFAYQLPTTQAAKDYDAANRLGEIRLFPSISETPWPAGTSLNSPEKLYIGTPITGNLAHFVDPNEPNPSNPTDLTATLSWSDGTVTSGTIVADPNVTNGYFVQGSHTFLTAGQKNVSIAITEASGNNNTIVNDFYEIQVLPTLSTIPTLTEGTAFSGVLATYTPFNFDGGTLTEKATIDWGDGTTSTSGSLILGLFGSVTPDPTGMLVKNGPTAVNVLGNHTYAADGQYTISITVTDTESGGTRFNGPWTFTRTENVSVNPTHNLAAVSAQSAYIVNDPVNETIAIFTDDGGTVSPTSDYTALISWGDGTSSPGTISIANNAYDIKASHNYTTTLSPSSHLTITVTETSTGQQLIMTETPVLDYAISDNSSGISVAATKDFSTGMILVASYLDSAPTRNLFALDPIINWGDGTTTTFRDPYTITETNKVINVYASHTYTNTGLYQITTVVIDDLSGGPGVSFATSHVTAAVTQSLSETAIPISLTEGDTFSGQIATFTDNGGNTDPTLYTATIQWSSDPNDTSIGTILYDSTNNNFIVTGSKTYVEEGSYPIMVTISDSNDNVSASTTATVADASLNLTSSNISLTATDGNPASGTVATFIDTANLSSDITSLSATILWGDNTTSAGIISSDGSGGYIVSGSHTYATDGSYNGTVQIKDDGVIMTTGSFAATITKEVTVTGGFSYTDTEGSSTDNQTWATFIDPAGPGPISSYSATIDWGDGSQSAGEIAQNLSTFYVINNHTYADEGNYTVTVTVHHNNSDVTATSHAIITDAPLQLQNLDTITETEGSDNSNVLLGQLFDARFDLSDHTSDFTVTLDWGDGSASTAGTLTFNAGSYSIYGNHIYNEGTYTVGITVVDDGGSTVTGTKTIHVLDAALSVTSNNNSFTTPENSALPNTTTLATFTDGDPNDMADLSATITWGDGTTSSGTLVSLGNGLYGVQGGHTYTVEGPYNGIVTLNDIGGSLANANFSVAVSDPAVTATGGYTITGTEGKDSGMQTIATFTDPAGAEDVINYSATIDWGGGNTDHGTISYANGVFTVQDSHTYAEEGTYSNITVSIYHDQAPVTIVTDTAIISDATLEKAFDPTPITVYESPFYQTNIGFFVDNNPHPDIHDFTATTNWGDGSAPDTSVQINDTFITDGQGREIYSIYGFHIYGDTAPITYTITTVVTDLGGSTVTLTDSVNVIDPPVTAAPGSYTAFIGSNGGTQTVATFFDPGGAEDVSDYSATIDWGDGTQSAGTILSLFNTFAVQGDHTYAQVGSPPITVTIHHDTAPDTIVNTNANITAANINATGGYTLNTAEGTALTSQTVATFTSGDLNLGDFSATINWGDSSAATAGTITLAGGTYTVSGAHTYAEEGTDPISVTINNIFGTTASTTSSAVVGDAALTATGSSFSTYVNGTFNGTVATFSDANLNAPLGDFTASINWGDGNTSTGTISSLGGGMFQVSGTHLYGTVGHDTVTIQVNDIGGSTANATATATVNDSPISMTPGTAISTIEGSTFTKTIATFTSPNNAPANIFTASINWGDGSTSLGTVNALGNGNYSVTGTHSYLDIGGYAVSISVLDSSDTGSTALLASVGEININLSSAAFSPMEGVSFTGTVGTFTTNNNAPASSYSSIINWGDGTTSLGTVTGNNGSYSVSGTHTYKNEATEKVNVTVYYNDSDFDFKTSSRNIRVIDAPITGSSVTLASINEGSNFKGAVATFTDANSAAPTSDFKAVINWGDGTNPTSGSIVSNGSGQFTVNGSHTYLQTGSHAVQVSIVDVGGSTTAVTDTININNVAPTAVNDNYSLSLGSATQLVISASKGVLNNDTDPGLKGGETLTAQLITGPSKGVLTLNADGSFIYTPNAGATTTDTFTYQAFDGLGYSNTATVTINIAADKPPVIDLKESSPTITYNQGQNNPLIIANDASIKDPDTQIFSGGTLTAALTSNGSADDILSIVQTDGVSLNGNNVYFNHLLVGTYIGGKSLNPLIITFNGNANQDAVQKIAEHIGYSNISTLPSSLTRTVSFTVTDGYGGTSGTVSEGIKFHTTTDNPVIQDTTVKTSVHLNTTTNIGSSLGLSITDSSLNSTEMLQINLSVTSGTLGFTNMTGLGNLIIQSGTASNVLDFKGTLSDINLALSKLTYTGSSLGLKTLTLQVYDNATTTFAGGLLETQKNFTLNVI